MTAPQKTLVIVTIFAAVGMVYYEANQAATLRIQVQALQRQQVYLSAEILELRSQHIDAAESAGSSAGTIAGIMSDPNFRATIHALENQSGFEQLSEPEAVSVSGRRENRMRTDIIFINTIPAATNRTPAAGQH